MKQIIFGIVFLLSASISLGQDMRIDKSEIDQAHVNQYNNSAERHVNLDSVFYYYNRALLIAEKISYKKGYVRSVNGLIELNKNHKQILERLRYPLTLGSYMEKSGTTEERVDANIALGKLYYAERLFSKSAEVLTKAKNIRGVDDKSLIEIRILLVRAHKNAGNISDALKIARELQDNGNLSLEQGISILKEKAEIYHNLKAYKEELGSYQKLLSLIRGTKYSYLDGITWNNVGYTQKYLGNLPASQEAFREVTATKSKISNDLRGTAYFNLGLNYQNAKSLDSAIIFLRKAVPLLQESKNWEQLAKCLNVQALVFYQQNDYYNAINALDYAFELAEEHKTPRTIARSHEIRSYVHQDLYEYEQALESFKKFLSIRDSLVTEDRNAERALLFDQYRVEEFEKRLRLIWAKNEFDLTNLARLKAEKEAEAEHHRAQEQANKLKISQLANSELRAREELNALMLQEQKLQLINQQNELVLAQRENELKELALEKERLSASEKEKEIELLAKQNELQEQIQLREKEEFANKLRFIISILFFMILILIGILLAYRQLRKRKKQIEEQSLIIIESKKLIEKEKEKSDSLLLNILPVSVAEELKLTGVSKPKSYDEVSVGFTDFAGFTMISEKLSPVDLVHKLDEIFLEFDKIVEGYNLQRIKTIGDAYMFASGLPQQMNDHAERCVRAGIDMRNFIEKYNANLGDNELTWNLRIGINSGPVVAGVIGIKKFAYDIWGDTVNLAARMESSGEIKKVNISGSTYAIVKDIFDHEHRGKVHAKNKGEVDMYFVEYKK